MSQLFRSGGQSIGVSASASVLPMNIPTVVIYIYILVGILKYGNPLHFPVENPMDRGAWCATVHGVAKSRTRLSDSRAARSEPRARRELGAERPWPSVSGSRRPLAAAWRTRQRALRGQRGASLPLREDGEESGGLWRPQDQGVNCGGARSGRIRVHVEDQTIRICRSVDSHACQPHVRGEREIK